MEKELNRWLGRRGKLRGKSYSILLRDWVSCSFIGILFEHKKDRRLAEFNQKTFGLGMLLFFKECCFYLSIGNFLLGHNRLLSDNKVGYYEASKPAFLRYVKHFTKNKVGNRVFFNVTIKSGTQ